MRSFELKSPDRKITLISNEVVNQEGKIIQEHGMIMRTVRSYAAPHIASGAWSTTTKGKLACFLGREARLHKTERFMQNHGIDLSKGSNNAKVYTAGFGKVHVLVNTTNHKNNFFKSLRVIKFSN